MSVSHVETFPVPGSSTWIAVFYHIIHYCIFYHFLHLYTFLLWILINAWLTYSLLYIYIYI